MPLTLYSSIMLVFTTTVFLSESVEQYVLAVTKDNVQFLKKLTVTYNSDPTTGEKTMPQVYMSEDPVSNMQIATKEYVDNSLWYGADMEMSDTSTHPVRNMVIKKYVDDHVAGSQSLGLKSAAVGQIAKITAVDGSGTPTAWEPADMPSGGASDFVVNGTIGSETSVGYSITLDKTADQILAAINEGKSVIARVASEITIDLPLVSFDTISGNIIFAGVINYMAMDSISPIIYFLRLRNDEATLYSSVAIALDSGGKMPQVSMATAPTRDMQIATKKYVDDKISDKELILSSSTVGSTKKFKLTIDDTGTLTASEITA